MIGRARKFVKASHVYSCVTPWERSEITRLYNERLPIPAIARTVGQSVRVVRTFLALEIQAKRIKEQLDLRQLEREIALAKKSEEVLLERRLGNVDEATAPRASDQYLHDKRAAKEGSRKLLEAIHRYLEKREAAQKEADNGTV